VCIHHVNQKNPSHLCISGPTKSTFLENVQPLSTNTVRDLILSHTHRPHQIITRSSHQFFTCHLNRKIIPPIHPHAHTRYPLTLTTPLRPARSSPFQGIPPTLPRIPDHPSQPRHATKGRIPAICAFGPTYLDTTNLHESYTMHVGATLGRAIGWVARSRVVSVRRASENALVVACLGPENGGPACVAESWALGSEGFGLGETEIA
jgi:hypothetical protein